MDSRENKVAFGMAFPDERDINKKIHGSPMPAGCLLVSVNGWINGEAMIPVPILGEIETVKQVVGSHVAWPMDWIIPRHLEVCISYKIISSQFICMKS